MTTAQTSLPKWILIVSGIFALMEIGVSFMMWFSPESVVETAEMKAKGVEYIMKMWAGRQFALGVILAYATFRRSIPMLFICYLFLLVMFIGDLVVGIMQNESDLILTAIVMCIISAVMLVVVNKRKSA